jgi:hypothetical protein
MSSDNDICMAFFNKNLKKKEEESKCELNKIIEEPEENTIMKKNSKNNYSYNYKNKSVNEMNDNNSNIFKIIYNQNNSNINNNKNESESLSSKKDENAFFTESNININSIDDNNNNNNKDIFIYDNLDNNSKNIKLNNNNNYLYSSSFSSSSSMNNNLNKIKKKVNINEDDIRILKEIYSNAKILSLDNSVPVSNNTTVVSKNIISENNNKNKNNIIIDNKKLNYCDSGNYMFTFQVNPKNKNKKSINIEVGFEVNYVEENDLGEDIYSKEDDDNPINIINNNDVLDSVCQKFCIYRKFNIYKKTNIINVLININKGKFFVVGEQELNELSNKDAYELSNNFNILYLCNCQNVPLENIREVRPVLNYNIKNKNFTEIIMNGKKLGNNNI